MYTLVPKQLFATTPIGQSRSKMQCWLRLSWGQQYLSLTSVLDVYKMANDDARVHGMLNNSQVMHSLITPHADPQSVAALVTSNAPTCKGVHMLTRVLIILRSKTRPLSPGSMRCSKTRRFVENKTRRLNLDLFCPAVVGGKLKMSGMFWCTANNCIRIQVKSAGVFTVVVIGRHVCVNHITSPGYLIPIWRIRWELVDAA